MNKRELFIQRTITKVKKAFQSKDLILIVVTRTIEDLDKIINTLGERLEDWYSIYFPELNIKDREKYAEFILEFDKSSTEEELKKLGSKGRSIYSKMQRSVGADFTNEDLEECRNLAKALLALYIERKSLQRYQRDLVCAIAPNTSELIGPELTSKLIAHVGSLRKLALLPASAIQILGAEKALFKHLRNKKVPSPKHGLIFMHPKISSTKKSLRGKVARALAAKISLALKADAFGSNNLGKKLKKEFEERFKEILKEAKK